MYASSAFYRTSKACNVELPHPMDRGKEMIGRKQALPYALRESNGIKALLQEYRNIACLPAGGNISNKISFTDFGIMLKTPLRPYKKKRWSCHVQYRGKT
ncbi:hypothetical protein Echvi_4261 [Echinicola vietnamensis DSM 17526]|uniref:Uncharacterized protein n=1 Tax=Echinicola vietnamensis (strain DSM 17526 / LMG 23754 / KMM 6221) TaxID=926556 RepID=L0G6I0_ECHVK|nr:hypothetical protein Echvi_4261 [Echinicola vietnamensis DSM 17526]